MLLTEKQEELLSRLETGVLTKVQFADMGSKHGKEREETS